MIDNVATNLHTNDVVDDTFVDLQHLTRCRISNVRSTSLSLVRALGYTGFIGRFITACSICCMEHPSY
jgi:hypothetical protein